MYYTHTYITQGCFSLDCNPTTREWMVPVSLWSAFLVYAAGCHQLCFEPNNWCSYVQAIQERIPVHLLQNFSLLWFMYFISCQR